MNVGDGMFYLYRDNFCNDLKKVHNTIFNILENISCIVSDGEQLFNIRLILSELLINAYEHGNGCDHNKSISIRFEINDQVINIEVVDEGQGIKNNCGYDYRELKSCGRGLLIVEKLTDKMEIRKNVIRCSLSI